MNKKIIIFALLALFLGSQTFAQIGWTTINNAVSIDNSKSHKLYFVDFYTTWCGWCKKMDSDTFKDPTVAKIMNNYFIPIKFDAEGTTSFSWNGTPYTGKGKVNGRAQTHTFANAILGQKMGFPSFAIFDAKQNFITVIPGYVKADEFAKILWYFASNDYTKYSWQQYDKIFISDIKPAMEKKLATK